MKRIKYLWSIDKKILCNIKFWIDDSSLLFQYDETFHIFDESVDETNNIYYKNIS